MCQSQRKHHVKEGNTTKRQAENQNGKAQRKAELLQGGQNHRNQQNKKQFPDVPDQGKLTFLGNTKRSSRVIRRKYNDRVRTKRNRQASRTNVSEPFSNHIKHLQRRKRKNITNMSFLRLCVTVPSLPDMWNVTLFFVKGLIEERLTGLNPGQAR